MPFIFRYSYSSRERSSDTQNGRWSRGIKRQSQISFPLNLDSALVPSLECGRNDVLGFLRPGHKKPCSFCLGLLEHLLLGCSFLESTYHALRRTSHTRDHILVLCWAVWLSSQLTASPLPVMQMSHPGQPASPVKPLDARSPGPRWHAATRGKPKSEPTN